MNYLENNQFNMMFTYTYRIYLIDFIGKPKELQR